MTDKVVVDALGFNRVPRIGWSNKPVPVKLLVLLALVRRRRDQPLFTVMTKNHRWFVSTCTC
jgi:hypothetical protein